MLFDVYAPTRTHDSLEVRVRAAAGGPVVLCLDSVPVELAPHQEHRGTFFYRHRFEGVESGTAFRLDARHAPSGATASRSISTLPTPPGAIRLRLGVIADPHLSAARASIDDYAPETRRLYGLSGELLGKYLDRLEALDVDAVVLLGDLVDPCTPEVARAAYEPIWAERYGEESHRNFNLHYP